MITATLFAAAVLYQQPQPSANTQDHQHGATDRALAFDGRDDFATIPACDAMAYPGSGGWTFELDLKPVIYPHRNVVTIVGQESVGVAARDPWSLRAHPSHLEFRIDDAHGASDSIRFDLDLGVWHRIACVYWAPGEQVQGTPWFALYVDGELVERRETQIVMEPRVDPVYLGALGNARFTGLIDNLMVWEDARTSEELSLSGLGLVDPNDPTLRGWWSFDESQGPLARDLTPRGNDAILGDPQDPRKPNTPARVLKP